MAATDAYTEDGKGRHPALGLHFIYQPAARHLAEEARQTANRQHQADVDLGPLLGGQIDG